MRKLFLSSLIFLTMDAAAYTPDVVCYRKMMQFAFRNIDSAHALYKSTRGIKESSPALLLGFKAMAELMMCNHVANPLTKLSYFNKGKKLLECAIAKEDNNAELRFMRFCTQSNTPGILDYKSDLKKDKSFLIRYLKEEKSVLPHEDEFRMNVKSYLLKSSFCSASEQILIKTL